MLSEVGDPDEAWTKHLKLKKGDMAAAKKARPSIHPNNIEVFVLNRNYYNGIVGGNSIDLVNIEQAMVYESIPLDERPFLARKLLIYISYCLSKKSEGKYGRQKT